MANPSVDLRIGFMKQRMMKFIAHGAIGELQVALVGLTLGAASEVHAETVIADGHFCISIPLSNPVVSFLHGLFFDLSALLHFMASSTKHTS